MRFIGINYVIYKMARIIVYSVHAMDICNRVLLICNREDAINRIIIPFMAEHPDFNGNLTLDFTHHKHGG